MKSLVKELFIGVMLLMIVVFTLGIIFYDSMPNNKLAPTSITYTADATVTSTIQQISEEKSKNNTTSSSNTSSGIDFGSVIASYSIGSTDLSIYESRKNYESGKTDPFEELLFPLLPLPLFPLSPLLLLSPLLPSLFVSST